MPFKSAFDLIDSVCNADPNQFRNLSDDDFNLFSEKYIELCEIREENLNAYLQCVNLHRTYLPVSSFTFGAINQIMWYYDEILLSDPVLYVLRDQNLKIGGKKYIIVDAIDALLRLKHRIDAGYVLLTNAGTLVDKESTKQEAERLLTIPSLADAFEREVVVYKTAGQLGNGENAGLIQLRGFYTGWNISIQPMGMYIPPEIMGSGKLKDGISFDFTGTYERISRQELRRLGKEDIVTQHELFRNDASLALSAIHNARQISIPGMFLRHVDLSVAMTHAYGYNDEQLATHADKADMFKSILPFVKGISPERLMKVREQMPDAFKNFRGLIFRLYQEAVGKGFIGNEINEWINQEVMPLKLRLEAEMKNALRGIRLDKQREELSFQKGSLNQTFGSSQVLSGALTNASTNPTFFLWKAGR